MGKFLAALIIVCAVGAGAAMYYLQVYGYYEEVFIFCFLIVRITNQYRL